MAQDIIYTAQAAHALPAATLAYVGDAVYELYVREHLLQHGHLKNYDLHKTAEKLVSARAQSGLVEALLPLLSDDEMRSYSRGRNTHLSVSKRNNPVTHCRATGFESVFGFLHLTGQRERIDALLTQLLTWE